MPSGSLDKDFYVRYYVGHQGKFGHEFLEFEFRPDGKLRYGKEGSREKEVVKSDAGSEKDKKENDISSVLFC